MPKVSVVVPVYGVEKYIGRCLESIIAQTSSDIEIIIVNDCTPDSSMDIVHKYALKDNRIKVLSHNTNKGLMCTRKTGYSAAQGCYITFCDSDDTLPVDAIESLYNLAIESDADIVSGDMQLLYDEGNAKRLFMNLPYGNDAESVYRALFEKKYTHNLCGKIFKCSLLQDYEYVTLPNFINGEDGMLFYQILQHVTDVVHLKEVVYYYYQNSSSSTHARIGDAAMAHLIDFYNYVVSIQYHNDKLNYLAVCYATDCVNEFAICQGYARMKRIIKNRGGYQYLSFLSRIKYMTLKQNLRWYVKYIVASFQCDK